MLVVAACSKEPRPPDVILFTLDTVRADHTGPYGAAGRTGSPTPLADAWAEDGIVFERCYAPRGQTHPSLASILTGKYPATHGLLRNGESLPPQHEPLPVLLKRRGYRTAAFCASLDRRRFDFWSRGFDVAEDGVGDAFAAEARQPAGQRGWDESVTRAAIDWIESLPGDDAPIFLWVHLFDSHEPHTPDAADAARFVDPAYSGDLLDRETPVKTQAERIRAFTLDDAPLDAADRAFLDQSYSASIAGCDARLGRIAAALDARGRLRGALRIYTADHGEDLGEHRRYYGHGNSIYDTSLHVPLVIAFTNRFRSGARVPQLAQNFDVFATIAAVAGAPLPVGAESLDLAPLARGESAARGREFVFGEWEDRIHSVSDGRWKLIHNPEGLQPRNPPFESRPGIGFPYRCRELYNVEEDPLEQLDLYAEGHPEARRLRAALDRFLGDHAAARRERGGRSATLDAASIEALHALGYLGGARQDLPRIDCGEARR